MSVVRGYPSWSPANSASLAPLSRAQARTWHEAFLAGKDARPSVLAEWFSEYGISLGSSRFLAEATMFLNEHVPATAVDGQSESPWYGVAMDLGIHMSETLIGASNGRVRWHLKASNPRSRDFQSTVLAGFADPRLTIDFIDQIVGYVRWLALGRDPVVDRLERSMAGAKSLI